MIIDFHTHVFPDKIARAAVARLSQNSGLTPQFDGTLNGLFEHMNDSGVDVSVVLPIATSPKQSHSIFEYAVEIDKYENIVSFSSVHPDSEDALTYIDKAAQAGLKGLKFHPDYQGFFIDSPNCIKTVKYAQKMGLVSIFHTGLDIGLPSPVHGNLTAMQHLVDSCGENLIVFSHMGGLEQWETAHRAFLRSKVYFDLAFCLNRMPDADIVDYIKERGSKYYLFATDAPWNGQKGDVERFLRLPFTQQQKDDVLFANALSILKR